MRACLLFLAVSLAGCSAFTIEGDNCPATITNGTAGAIWFLYVRDSGAEDWGDDHLGAERLEDSETFELNVSPGSYDVRGEWPSPGSETFTKLDAFSCVDGEDVGTTFSLTDQD